MKKRIQLHGKIILAFTLLIALYPSFFLRAREGRLDAWLEVAGLALILLGLLFRVSSRGYKSEHSKEGYALVVGGPYSIVRNPMYLGIFTTGTGMVLLLFQWWVFFALVIFMAVQYFRLILEEEKKLIQAFGEEYRAYQQRVPRLFPNPASLLGRELTEYFPLRWRWIWREASSIFIVPLVSVGLECWENTRLKKHPFVVSEYTGFLMTFGLCVLLVICLIRRYESLSGQVKAA